MRFRIAISAIFAGLMISVAARAQFIESETMSCQSAVQYTVSDTTSVSDGPSNALTSGYSVQKKQNSGQPLIITGNVLMSAGAAMVMSGLAGVALGAITKNKDPQHTATPLTPLFAAGSFVASAFFALSGYLFYISGQNRMDGPGPYQQIPNLLSQKGFSCIIEMEACAPGAFGIDVMAGSNISHSLFLGGGIGYRLESALPIYGTVRYTFGKGMISPFVGARFGYNAIGSDYYASMDFGTRYRRSKGERGSSWFSSLSLEIGGKNWEMVGIKVGRSF